MINHDYHKIILVHFKHPPCWNSASLLWNWPPQCLIKRKPNKKHCTCVLLHRHIAHQRGADSQVSWEWLDVRTTCFFPKQNEGGWQVLLNVSSDRLLPSPAHPWPLPAADSVYVWVWVNIVYKGLGWSLATLGCFQVDSDAVYLKGGRSRRENTKGRSYDQNRTETAKENSWRQKRGEPGAHTALLTTMAHGLTIGVQWPTRI